VTQVEGIRPDRAQADDRTLLLDHRAARGAGAAHRRVAFRAASAAVRPTRPFTVTATPSGDTAALWATTHQRRAGDGGVGDG